MLQFRYVVARQALMTAAVDVNVKDIRVKVVTWPGGVSVTTASPAVVAVRRHYRRMIDLWQLAIRLYTTHTSSMHSTTVLSRTVALKSVLRLIPADSINIYPLS